MKRFKKMMALVIAMVMALAMVLPALADVAAGTYTIKVTNGNPAVSINGKTYSAYKLFDVTYQNPEDNPNTVYGNDTAPHAYTLSTTSPFYTTAAAKAIIEEYFVLTAIEGDTSKVVVTPILDANDKSTFTADKAYELAQKLNPYLTMAANATATASGEVATIDVSNKGDAGYYLVTGEGKAYAEGDETGTATGDDVTAAVALTTTDPKAEIIAKVDGVSVEKEIDEGTTEGAVDSGDVKEDNHAVGDNVPYIVKSKMPNMTGYEKYYFIFKDTMGKGLTFKNDIAIKFVDSTGTVKKTLASPADYTVTTTGGNGADTNIEVVFKNFIQYKGTLVTADNLATVTGGNDKHLIGTYWGAYEDCDIIITYSGDVNQYAVIGDLGNPNTATIEYSNKPDVADGGQPDNPDKPLGTDITGTTPGSTVKTYVTGLKVLKYTGTTSTVLADAKFELTGENLNKLVETTTTYFRAIQGEEVGTHYLLKDGTYTTAAPIEDDAATTDVDEDTLHNYVVTWGQGTPAPGYITDTMKTFALEGTKPSTKVTATTDKEGILTFTGLCAGDYVLEETEAPAGYNKLKDKIYINVSVGTTEEGNLDTHSWTIKYKLGVSGTEQTLTSSAANANLFELDVENQAGQELPSTGGIGTTIFYIVGAILVVGAGILLVTRRRMSAN